MKKFFYVISFVAIAAVSLAAFSLPKSASADSIVGGNDRNQRSIVDTASNFTVIDTNHPVSANGQITSFGYYASNTNPFQFVVVDGSNVVKYVSPQISASASGAGTYVPANPIDVKTGWNIGLYFPSTGAVPFDATGANAFWTTIGGSAPAVGSTLSQAGSSARTYSVAIYGTVAPAPCPNCPPCPSCPPCPNPNPNPQPEPEPNPSPCHCHDYNNDGNNNGDNDGCNNDDYNKDGYNKDGCHQYGRGRGWLFGYGRMRHNLFLRFF